MPLESRQPCPIVRKQRRNILSRRGGLNHRRCQDRFPNGVGRSVAARRIKPQRGRSAREPTWSLCRTAGYRNGCRYLLHDRDQKFCHKFRETLAAGGVECRSIPARQTSTPAERWVRSIKEECLSKAKNAGINIALKRSDESLASSSSSPPQDIH
jgi:hypothetical protein